MEGYLSQAKSCGELVGTPRATTVSEQLTFRRDKVIAELAEVDAAIALFQQHPGIEQCLNALHRVGIYR